MKPLVLAGPTAAGKSAVAMAVARRFGAVVLSADAMQVYRGFDIGTAKPSLADQAQIPHSGLDCIDPHESFSAADFLALADQVLAGTKPVVVVGGTSLYLRALVRGLVPTPPVQPALRASLATRPDLHSQLAAVDPVLAARLHPNDRVRVIRGLEVYLTSGNRLSELHAAHAAQPDQRETVGLWLDREALNDRIDARVLAMTQQGYVQEVRGLLASGVDRTLKPMQTLGYRHLASHLVGDLPLEEAIRRTQRDTRQFARKQRNWRKQLGYPLVIQDHEQVAMRAAQAAFAGAR